MDNRETVCTYRTITASTTQSTNDWSVFFTSMAETSPNTPITAVTQDLRRNTAFPLPETKTYQLEDGSIRIEIGQFWKVVSSWHLVDSAENQLVRSYRDHYR